MVDTLDRFRRLSSLGVLLTIAVALAWSGDAAAHTNPPGCTSTGAAFLIRELRDIDGMTLPGDNGPGETQITGAKVQGETIYYEARLAYGGLPQCGYGGGTLCIDPPGPVGCTDVTPVGGIPLICSDPSCSPAGVSSVFSQQLAYVVDAAHAGGCFTPGQIRGEAQYLNGTSHFGAGDVSPVNATISICNAVTTPTPTPMVTVTPTVTATLQATQTATPSVTRTPTTTATRTPGPKCKREISAAFGDYVATVSTEIHKCKSNVISKGTIPSLGDCQPGDLPKISLAAQKLHDRIENACGGEDKTCATTADNDSLASINWARPSCPNIAPGGGNCNNSINDCDDIADCLACIGQSGVESSLDDLLFDEFRADQFTTKNVANKCQIAIAKAGLAFINEKTNVLGKCWDAKLNGKPGFADADICPDTDPGLGSGNPPAAPGDNKTVEAIKKAEQKKVAAICKACGAGGDKDKDGVCDAPPGLPIASVVEAPFTCPEVSLPPNAVHPGGVDCADNTVTDLQSYIECVDCVLEFYAGCMSAAGVGDLNPAAGIQYPSQCVPGP